MKYIVVKNAGYGWDRYFDSDPTEGAHISHSAHLSYTGKIMAIEASYDTLEEANFAAYRCNEHNPSGNYAACLMIE